MDASDRELHGPRLPHDADLDLPRELQLALDAARDLLGQRVGLLVAGVLGVQG
jgi:hypothetical protein